MPCYVVQTQSVEFNAKNVDLIEDMLKANGLTYRISQNRTLVRVSFGYYSIDIDLARQEMTGQSQSNMNELKRKYSEHILKVAAKKKGWVLKRKRGAQNQFLAKRW